MSLTCAGILKLAIVLTAGLHGCQSFDLVYWQDMTLPAYFLNGQNVTKIGHYLPACASEVTEFADRSVATKIRLVNLNTSSVIMEYNPGDDPFDSVEHVRSATAATSGGTAATAAGRRRRRHTHAQHVHQRAAAADASGQGNTADTLTPGHTGLYRCITDDERVSATTYQLNVVVPPVIASLAIVSALHTAGTEQAMCTVTGFPEPTVTMTIAGSSGAPLAAVVTHSNQTGGVFTKTYVAPINASVSPAGVPIAVTCSVTTNTPAFNCSPASDLALMTACQNAPTEANRTTTGVSTAGGAAQSPATTQSPPVAGAGRAPAQQTHRPQPDQQPTKGPAPRPRTQQPQTPAPKPQPQQPRAPAPKPQPPAQQPQRPAPRPVHQQRPATRPAVQQGLTATTSPGSNKTLPMPAKSAALNDTQDGSETGASSGGKVDGTLVSLLVIAGSFVVIIICSVCIATKYKGNKQPKSDSNPVSVSSEPKGKAVEPDDGTTTAFQRFWEHTSPRLKEWAQSYSTENEVKTDVATMTPGYSSFA
eukprot:scpid56586/ scgid13718/ 